MKNTTLLAQASTLTKAASELSKGIIGYEELTSNQELWDAIHENVDILATAYPFDNSFCTYSESWFEKNKAIFLLWLQIVSYDLKMEAVKSVHEIITKDQGKREGFKFVKKTGRNDVSCAECLSHIPKGSSFVSYAMLEGCGFGTVYHYAFCKQCHPLPTKDVCVIYNEEKQAALRAGRRGDIWSAKIAFKNNQSNLYPAFLSGALYGAFSLSEDSCKKDGSNYFEIVDFILGLGLKIPESIKSLDYEKLLENEEGRIYSLLKGETYHIEDHLVSKFLKVSFSIDGKEENFIEEYVSAETTDELDIKISTIIKKAMVETSKTIKESNRLLTK